MTIESSGDQSIIKFEIESITLSEIKNKQKAGALVLRPDYQRNFVWPVKARISLIETILLGYPVPEVYLAYQTDAEGDESIQVVDGQQRMTSIMEFYRDELELDEESLETEYSKENFSGKKFSDFTDDEKKRFWGYRIPVRRLSNVDDSVIREVFARVNRVNMVLTDQELRSALYPGEFYDFLKDCAASSLAIRSGVFSGSRRLRGGDLEFFAEVFLTCLFGLGNKKSVLKDNYESVSRDFESYRDDSIKFLKILDSLEECIDWKRRTRWSNIVDLYTLIYTLWDLDICDVDELKKYVNKLIVFQGSVNILKRADGYSDLVDDDILTELKNQEISEAYKDSLIEISQEYSEGIRNSSDLAARRKRYAALKKWLLLEIDN